MYFLQNWYAVSDPMAEETLYDSEAMRRFAGIGPGDDRIPDVEGTVAPVGPHKPRGKILNFRHLLERHGLTEAIFAEVNGHLTDKGITLCSGTLVDVSGHTPLMEWMAPAPGVALRHSRVVERTPSKGAIHGRDYHNRPRLGQVCFSGSCG